MALFLYDKEISEKNRSKLHDEILTASKDSFYHVRKAVASYLKTLIEKMPQSDVIEIVDKLVHDISDVVKFE